MFCNKAKTTIQILEWDDNGFWIHKKKLLGKDRYRWPKTPEEVKSFVIDERQLKWLLSGLEINQKHAHHVVKPIVKKDWKMAYLCANITFLWYNNSRRKQVYLCQKLNYLKK